MYYLIYYNKFAKDIVDAKIKQAKLASKDDIADFVKEAYFEDKQININQKITLNKTKHILVYKIKNYKHFTQVFLSVKVTLLMMDHKIN